MFMMPEEDRVEAGHPKLSELIKLLEAAKERYGDIPVSGAYDGDWNEKVYIQFFRDHIIIGSIS